MSVIYLSGPMSGYPDLNYPLFHRVAGELRNDGHRVYNPAEFQHDEPVFPIRKAFAEYCLFICNEADTIVLLPGWEKSLGVSAELALARNCGLAVVYHEIRYDFRRQDHAAQEGFQPEDHQPEHPDRDGAR